MKTIAFLSLLWLAGSMTAQETWTLTNGGLPAGHDKYHVSDFETLGSSVYACGEYFTGTANKILVYKTSNNGGNWSAISTPSPLTNSGALTSYGTKLLVSGYDADGGTYKLLSSANNGQSWSPVAGWPPQFQCSHFQVVGTDMYACGAAIGGSYLLQKSGNGGANWSQVNGTGLNGVTFANAIVLHNGKLFLSGTISAGPTNYNYVLMTSNDHGQSWSSAANGLPPSFLAHDLVSDGTTLYATGEFNDPANGNFARFKIYYSVDDGDNWTEQTTIGLPSILFNGLALHLNNNRFFLSVPETAGSDAAIYISDHAITTGIKNLSSKNGISVYPVPTGQQLCVTLNSGDRKTFSLINELGCVAMSGTLKEGTNAINTEPLSAGIYCLKTSDGNVVKIIKE